MTIKALYTVGGSEVCGIPDWMMVELRWEIGDDVFFLQTHRRTCLATNKAEKLPAAKKETSATAECEMHKRKIIRNCRVAALIFPAELKASMGLQIKKYVELDVLAHQVLRIKTMI